MPGAGSAAGGLGGRQRNQARLRSLASTFPTRWLVSWWETQLLFGLAAAPAVWTSVTINQDQPPE